MPQDDNNEELVLSPRRRNEILRECEALVVYISRHGDILEEKQNSGNLNEAYVELSNLVANCARDELGTESWGKLVVAYAQVTRVTYRLRGVNGRSLLDTWGGNDPIFGTKNKNLKSLSKPSRWFNCKGYRYPLCATVLFFSFALLLQAIAGWAGRVDDPSSLSEAYKIFYYLADDLLPFLIPAIWGALGSCIFLMKRLSDKLFALAYEQSKVKGASTRIWLGAILGVMVIQIFFPSYSETLAMGDISFGPTTAAFVAGLGVKPIYAAFNALVEGIAARMSGGGKATDK